MFDMFDHGPRESGPPPEDGGFFWVKFLIVMVIFFAAFVLVETVARKAGAHEAQSGWTYPLECCSGNDCYEIDANEIEARPDGYLIRATGEVWAFDRVKVAPDGRMHRCSYRGDRKQPTICLFLPAGA